MPQRDNCFEEEQEDNRRRLLGAGLAGFVNDVFRDHLKRQPLRWIGPEIVRAVVAGRSPFLTYDELRSANTRAALNLLVWQSGISAEDWSRAEVFNYPMVTFVELHRGYCLRELLGQGEPVGHLMGMVNTGGLIFDPATRTFCNVDVAEGEAMRIMSEPHLIGITREIATRVPGSWVAAMFLYQPPRLGLSRGAQRLVGAALEALDGRRNR